MNAAPQLTGGQQEAPPRRLKVLMLTLYPYVPEDERLGGIMQASFRLIAGLDALQDPRIDLYIVTQTEHIETRCVRKLNGNTTVIYYPLESRVLDAVLFGYPSVSRALQDVLRELSPDLIHGQGTAKYIFAATHASVPHIITIHGIYQNEMKVVRSRLTLAGRIARRAKILLERYYVGRIRNLIAITDEVRTFVRAHAPAVRSFDINNAIDGGFFGIRPLRPDQPPVVLFVAAITYRKGLDYLLAAFPKVLERVPAARLRIAGVWDWDPAYVEGLKAQYASLITQGTVAFLGGVTQEQLLLEMEDASLLCLPSRAESAPMVISQAMAAARPVVASRVGGIPGMIEDGLTGSLWELGDVESLAGLLAAMLTDFERASAIGAAARAVATQRYSALAVARQTVEAYLATATHG